MNALSGRSWIHTSWQVHEKSDNEQASTYNVSTDITFRFFCILSIKGTSAKYSTQQVTEIPNRIYFMVYSKGLLSVLDSERQSAAGVVSRATSPPLPGFAIQIHLNASHFSYDLTTVTMWIFDISYLFWWNTGASTTSYNNQCIWSFGLFGNGPGGLIACCSGASSKTGSTVYHPGPSTASQIWPVHGRRSVLETNSRRMVFPWPIHNNWDHLEFA